MKDLPTDLAGGLAMGAMLQREDPRDTFVSLKYDRLADTPAGREDRHEQHAQKGAAPRREA